MGKKIVVVNAGPRKGWNTDILLFGSNGWCGRVIVPGTVTLQKRHIKQVNADFGRKKDA